MKETEFEERVIHRTISKYFTKFCKNPSCASLTISWLPLLLVYFPTWSLFLSLPSRHSLLVALVVLVIGFRV
jgi:hypothetical protein